MEINEIWTYNHSDPILTLEMGDLCGNGQTEVIATTKKGAILVFSLEGNILLEEIISDQQPLWHSNLFDADGDGRNELVIGGMDGFIRVFKYTRPHKLEQIWTHQFNSSISGIFFDDIDNNKQKELISYSLDKTIRVLNPLDGSMIWGQIFEDGIGDAILWSDSEDLNNGEIIACGNDGTIRSFNKNNGELKWFKRYSNKLRCISTLTSKFGQLIATGGDDKILHLINTTDYVDIKTIEFKDYVWKLQSFPDDRNDKLIVSTYSFDYLDDSPSIEDIIFTSKLVCIDRNLEILWEINGINIESLEVFELKNMKYLLIGTTKGKIMLIEGVTGKIVIKIEKNSCVNMVKYSLENHLIFSCHDDGSLHSFKGNRL